MTEDLELTKKRFIELAGKAERGLYYTFTDFLGLAEQAALAEVEGKISSVKRTQFGGVEGAERFMVRFGDEEELGYDQPFPIRYIKVAPVSQKFAEKLSHRDILGSLMGLGIERDKLGDIILKNNEAYLVAHEDIAPYITRELIKVRRTDVRCEIVGSMPSDVGYSTEQRSIQIAGERLDAVIAKVYNLSREEAQLLFRRGLVYVGGRECSSLSYTPRQGVKITVRGYGRFIYLGFSSLSRKGKINANILVYV